MIGDNKLIVAAAGSGKTTFLVEEALKIGDERVLITTYTESNAEEIRQRFIRKHGCVPSNVVIMTWFSFLITHGVKPFQGGLFNYQVAGMVLVAQRSGLKYVNNVGKPVYWGEADFDRYYFDRRRNVYSDKLPKLVIRCNKVSGDAVVDRISRIFPNVFVDEVQDLAGYDLDILAVFARSAIRLLMVGDPRQVTYLTHHELRHRQYAQGGISAFMREKLPKKVSVEIDEETLRNSHRNNQELCVVSSRLYPELPVSRACNCAVCRASPERHLGLFIVRKADFAHYLSKVRPMQLRDNISSAGVDPNFPAMNIGASKGRGFDHVVILPTKPMRDWLKNSDTQLKPQSRAKFYVALTRARHSVAVAMNWNDQPLPEGFALYERGD